MDRKVLVLGADQVKTYVMNSKDRPTTGTFPRKTVIVSDVGHSQWEEQCHGEESVKVDKCLWTQTGLEGTELIKQAEQTSYILPMPLPEVHSPAGALKMLAVMGENNMKTSN